MKKSKNKFAPLKITPEEILKSFTWCPASGNKEVGFLRHKLARQGVKVGSFAGSISSAGYKQIFLHGKRYSEHRLCFLLANGFDGVVVDHINGIKTDNRAENLRSTSQSANIHSSKSSKKNLTGFRGVVKTPGGKYRAQMMVNGVTLYLGSFSTPESAAQAYNKAAEAHYKNLAKLNVIY